MKTLDRLPIHEEPAPIRVQGEVVQVGRNQAIVWVGIADLDGDRRTLTLRTAGWF